MGHTTNNCVRFKDLIQKAIKEGRLKFEEKEATMKVDTNPFEVSLLSPSLYQQMSLVLNLTLLLIQRA